MNNLFNTEAGTARADPRTAADAVPIGPLVRSFFTLLDSDGISWAILRGSDGLPEHTRYDIDILVGDGGIERADATLGRAAEAQGWQRLRIIEKYRYRCLLLVSPGPHRRFLPIDLLEGCYYRFFPTADAGYALRQRRQNNQGVWVVPPGFGAAEALIKELMRHDSFKANSREESRQGALADPDSFIAGTLSCLGEPLAQRLLVGCQRGDWAEVEAMAPEIRRRIRSRRWARLPGLMGFGWKNLWQHLRPPMSQFIVLLGPDGAGKSTIADLAVEQLYHRPFKTCRRFEHRFGLLPELKQIRAATARLLGRQVSVQAPPSSGTKGSGMNKEHGALRAMLYVAYYSLDLVIGRLLLRRLRGQGGLIVFARYFYDYYYQKGYGHAPRWFLRLIERAVPTPDLILYLHRRAEDIYAGKPELDLTEIERQQTVIMELLKGRENAQVVDASGGVEATVQDVVQKAISRWLSQTGDPAVR